VSRRATWSEWHKTASVPIGDLPEVLSTPRPTTARPRPSKTRDPQQSVHFSATPAARAVTLTSDALEPSTRLTMENLALSGGPVQARFPRRLSRAYAVSFPRLPLPQRSGKRPEKPRTCPQNLSPSSDSDHGDEPDVVSIALVVRAVIASVLSRQRKSRSKRVISCRTNPVVVHVRVERNKPLAVLHTNEVDGSGELEAHGMLSAFAQTVVASQPADHDRPERERGDDRGCHSHQATTVATRAKTSVVRDSGRLWLLVVLACGVLAAQRKKRSKPRRG
jgi:hypothetical protein